VLLKSSQDNLLKKLIYYCKTPRIYIQNAFLCEIKAENMVRELSITLFGRETIKGHGKLPVNARSMAHLRLLAGAVTFFGVTLPP
jgi:hypothetical protein